MIKYYREPNGDYLSLDTDLLQISRNSKIRPEQRDVRAAVYDGMPDTVQGTITTVGYLKRCRRVTRVPKEWKRYL